jgi:hypothetical protein
MTIWITFILFVNVVTCKLQRVQCLQKPMGTTSGHWTKSRIIDSDIPTTNTSFEWTYVNDKCLLRRFNLDSFCKSSLLCGKHIVMVGDSTVSSLIDFWESQLPAETTHLTCPPSTIRCPPASTPTSYKPPSIWNNGVGVKGCVRDESKPAGHHRKLAICKSQCPNKQTTITFFRHDYLFGVHGEWFYQSTVCDSWQEYARAADVLLVSFGLHLDSMFLFPHTRPVSSDDNITALIRESAKYAAGHIRELMKPGSLVIYRTSHFGVENHFSDCSAPPSEVPAKPRPIYSWDQIPPTQYVYMNALKKAFHKRSVSGKRIDYLEINHQWLMAMRPGCRLDYVHFKTETWESPVAIDWQILQNLLFAYHQKTSTKHERRS